MSAPVPSANPNFRQLQFVLAADLDRLHVLADYLQLPALAAKIEQSRERLADPRFTLAVVGEFKRGKSTLVNALLGGEILPSDIEPTSAAISRITYGNNAKARLLHRDGSESRIPFESLPQFITAWTETSTANAAGIKEAVISYPATLCRDNLDLVDTPGLCDDPLVTRVTRDFLPCADAVIFVILATSPFSESEWELLDSIVPDFGLSGVFFIVNALDRLHSESDRERVVSLIRARIAQRVRERAAEKFGCRTPEFENYLNSVGEPKVFGMSGQLALDAKLAQDDAHIEATGLPQFERFLLNYLADNRGILSLKTHFDRVARVCGEICEEATAAAERKSTQPNIALATGFESLLNSAEWLIADAMSRLAAHQSSFESHARQWVDRLPSAYSQKATHFLSALRVSGEDLDETAFPGFLHRVLTDLRSELQIAADQEALTFVSTLKQHLAVPLSEILRFALAFDRIISHGTCLPGFAFAHYSLRRQMGDSADAALDWILKPHFATLTQVAREWLSAYPEWTAGLTINRMPSAGPKFMKKAVDFVRAATVKTELSQAVPLAIKNHLAQSAATRMQRVSQQAVQVNSLMAAPLDLALQQVRSRMYVLRSSQERAQAAKLAEADLVRRHKEEIMEIQARCAEVARRLGRTLSIA